MMRASVGPILVAATAVLSGGCIYSHSGVESGVRAWQTGVTPRRDVVGAWGNPDFIRDGDWTWRETESIGGKFKAGYMGIGVTLANSSSAVLEQRLTFDENGRLLRQETARSLPDGARWSPVPFGD